MIPNISQALQPQGVAQSLQRTSQLKMGNQENLHSSHSSLNILSESILYI